MTSLKVKYADETMDAMAKILDSTEFKEIYRTASLNKEAGPAFEAFKKDVDAAVVAKTDLELVYSKHVNDLAQEDNTEPGTVQKAREYMTGKGQPGMTMPPQSPQADDACADCLDTKELVAADFTMKHLVKIADALDGKGFASLAGIVDEAIEKVASKKKVVKMAAWPETPPWDPMPQSKETAPWESLPQSKLPNVEQPKAAQPPKTVQQSSVESVIIKKVQKMLGVKDDGKWGPKTAAAWNKYVVTLGEPWSKAGVDPSGSYHPAVETMKSALMGAESRGRQERTEELKGMDKTRKDSEKPQPAAVAKPAQVVDQEQPSETARQKELRQRFPGVGSYNPNK